MQIFSNIKAESESIEDQIESMELRIEGLEERESKGETDIMYRGEKHAIQYAIRDLKDRIKAFDRLNED